MEFSGFSFQHLCTYIQAKCIDKVNPELEKLHTYILVTITLVTVFVCLLVGLFFFFLGGSRSSFSSHLMMTGTNMATKHVSSLLLVKENLLD